MVHENGFDIKPDRHDLLHAKFYDPQGNLVSEVKNRTGKQILCDSNGSPWWELDLVDGEYSHLKQWHPNGQLAYERCYRDGRQCGEVFAYFPNGQLKHRGKYKNGERIGIWTYYAENGEIKSQTNYDAAPD